MFLQSNAEHSPPVAGGKQGGKGGRRGGGNRLILCAIYWLVLSQPSHYIMSKTVNKQITTVHQRPQRGLSAAN